MPVVWRLRNPALGDTSTYTNPLSFNDMGRVSLNFGTHHEQYLWVIFKNTCQVSQKPGSRVLFTGLSQKSVQLLTRDREYEPHFGYRDY